MDKEDVVNLHNRILAIENEWSDAIHSNMNGTRDCHTEWSQTEKDKYYILHVCGILKKKATYELIWKT